MRELREMISDAEYLYTLNDDNLAEEVLTTNRAQNLFVAVIDNMPELLDAWEKWSALMFARQQGCETCPMNAEGDRTADNCGMCDVALFDCLPQWQKAWRDAQKIEGVTE